MNANLPPSVVTAPEPPSETGQQPVTLADIAAQVWQPDELVRRTLAALDGDIVVLGAGGKMGVSLSLMVAAALADLPGDRVVHAVSRFSEPAARDELAAGGVSVHVADLLDPDDVAALPDAAGVVYLAGRKFGTQADATATWAVNVLTPDLICRRYRGTPIAALSSGAVYPLQPLTSGGAVESTGPMPVGEYAQTTLGRERIFSYRSVHDHTPVSLVRLNYAIDCRYGVLTDIARAVATGQPVVLDNPVVNVLWQGDANRYILASLAHAGVPPFLLNITGPETASVRHIAEQLGERLGRAPVFAGQESDTAPISNAGKAFGLFGYPRVPLERMLDWVVAWLDQGGRLLEKPTQFSEREGRH